MVENSSKKILYAIIFYYLFFLFIIIIYIVNLQNIWIKGLQLNYPIGQFEAIISFFKSLFFLFFIMLNISVLIFYFIYKNMNKNIIIYTIIKNETEDNRIRKIKLLSDEERIMFNLITGEGKEVFQNDLVDRSGLPRYTVSRILSRFESYGIIKKERYGITNKIILKIDTVESQ